MPREMPLGQLYRTAIKKMDIPADDIGNSFADGGPEAVLNFIISVAITEITDSNTSDDGARKFNDFFGDIPRLPRKRIAYEIAERTDPSEHAGDFHDDLSVWGIPDYEFTSEYEHDLTYNENPFNDERLNRIAAKTVLAARLDGQNVEQNDYLEDEPSDELLVVYWMENLTISEAIRMEQTPSEIPNRLRKEVDPIDEWDDDYSIVTCVGCGNDYHYVSIDGEMSFRDLSLCQIDVELREESNYYAFQRNGDVICSRCIKNHDNRQTNKLLIFTENDKVLILKRAGPITKCDDIEGIETLDFTELDDDSEIKQLIKEYGMNAINTYDELLAVTPPDVQLGGGNEPTRQVEEMIESPDEYSFSGEVAIYISQSSIREDYKYILTPRSDGETCRQIKNEVSEAINYV